MLINAALAVSIRDPRILHTGNFIYVYMNFFDLERLLT